MAATTSPPEAAGDAVPLPRFSRVERIAHWVNAGLFGLVMITGAFMYFGELSSVVGNRLIVRTLHIYGGLAIPVVFLIALTPRWGRALRADLARLNRWSRDDRRWFRGANRQGRDRVRLGKFNPGQKLNAAFVFGAAVVMVGTGSIMHWYGPFSDAIRQGATFTHDWFALFIWVSVIGHVMLAFGDPDALGGMVRGTVSPRWARTKRPGWYDEVTAPAATARETSGDPPPRSQ